MELHHFGISQLCSCLIRHGDPVTGTLPGVGGDLVHSAPTTGGDDDGPGAKDDESAVFSPVPEGATHSIAVLQEARHRALHIDVNPGVDALVLQGSN